VGLWGGGDHSDNPPGHGNAALADKKKKQRAERRLVPEKSPDHEVFKEETVFSQAKNAQEQNEKKSKSAVVTRGSQSPKTLIIR